MDNRPVSRGRDSDMCYLALGAAVTEPQDHKWTTEVDFSHFWGLPSSRDEVDAVSDEGRLAHRCLPIVSSRG